MKQFVPGLFRRGGNKKKAPQVDANPAGPDSNDLGDPPAIEEVKIALGDYPRDIVVNGDCNGTTGTTISTLANDRQEATMKMCGSLLREDGDERSVGSFETAYNDDKAVGIGHLPMREQMWYKNQLYLLRKELPEDSPHRRRGRLAVSTCGSIDSGVKRYAAGINKHADSPTAVDEFESTNMYKNMRHCDSRRETGARFNNNPPSSILRSSKDDDARTNVSSSLLNYDDSTVQSSSLFDDEDPTNPLSSTLDTSASKGRSNADGPDSAETESFLASLEDGTTSTSYVFELVDDGRRRRKYQMGVGQQQSTMAKIRRVLSTTRSVSIVNSLSWSNPPAAEAASREGTDDDDDADFAGNVVLCPLLPAVLEDAPGWGEDARSALTQVLHAFFISPDDVDLLSERIQGAKLELAEMYRRRTDCGRDRRSSPRRMDL